MKNNLLFDFTVDKAAKTVFITREFDAELSLVWDAFTKQEILDQWAAPAPWIAKTKYMNFEVGGQRFYAMVSPEGQEMLGQFKNILPLVQKPISNCLMLLQTKMKTLNCQVLNGITISANKTVLQK
ncbi:MAG: SRPBCC domain-containing protein [Segetibacter sp.]